MARIIENVAIVIIFIVGFWAISLEDEHINTIRMFLFIFTIGSVVGIHFIFDNLDKIVSPSSAKIYHRLKPVILLQTRNQKNSEWKWKLFES